jgi:RNA polymerase sigma-70 factor (ECF subfamily)
MGSAIRTLTRAIRAGDGAALEQLYRARFDRLHAAARSRTRRDEAFCLDLVQEVFLRVIRALPVLDSEAQLDAWLVRTLDRCAIDALRRECRMRRRERAHGAARASAAEGPGGGSLLSRAPDAGALLDRVSALPAAAKSLLEQRFRFGWTLQHIGLAAGLAPGAVDGRIARALDRLRKELDDDEA